MRHIEIETRTGKTIRFSTELTNGEAAQILAENTRGDEFVDSLIQAHKQYGPSLSRGREQWLLFKAQQVLDKASKPAPVKTRIGDLSGVLELFESAKVNGLKFPKVRLQLEDGTPVVLSVAGAGSRYAGQVLVSEGKYPAPLFGRIESDGGFTGSHVGVIELLRALAADPAGVAAEYGVVTGSCCFCGLGLTDERSLAVGYGPVCSDRYGLPWGERKTPKTYSEPVVVEVPVEGLPLSLEWLLDRAPQYAESYA